MPGHRRQGVCDRRFCKGHERRVGQGAGSRQADREPGISSQSHPQSTVEDAYIAIVDAFQPWDRLRVRPSGQHRSTRRDGHELLLLFVSMCPTRALMRRRASPSPQQACSSGKTARPAVVRGPDWSLIPANRIYFPRRGTRGTSINTRDGVTRPCRSRQALGMTSMHATSSSWQAWTEREHAMRANKRKDTTGHREKSKHHHPPLSHREKEGGVDC